MSIGDVDEMMRQTLPFRSLRLCRADIKASIDLSGIGRDEFKPVLSEIVYEVRNCGRLSRRGCTKENDRLYGRMRFSAIQQARNGRRR